MITKNNLKFDTGIGFLYKLKSERKHTTVQETINALQDSSVDNMIDVIRVSYCKGMNVEMSNDQFIQFISDNNFGIFFLTSIYTEIVEAVMFDGLSEQERKARKNELEKLIKK